MIHPAFYKSEIARRYYLAKTGEDLPLKVAMNRWRMTTNIDKKILSKVINRVLKEQERLLA